MHDDNDRCLLLAIKREEFVEHLQDIGKEAFRNIGNGSNSFPFGYT